MPVIKKQLGPIKFGLGDDQARSRKEILSAARRRMAEFRKFGTTDPDQYPAYTPSMLDACELLLDVSSQLGTKPNLPISTNGRRWPSDITPQQLAIIGSDFGEVAGAVFVLSAKNLPITRGTETIPLQFTEVKFPVTEQNELFDYEAITPQGDVYKISAKYIKGGAPSISAMQPLLNQWVSQDDWASLSEVGLDKDRHFVPLQVMNLLGIERRQLRVSDLFRGPIEAAEFLVTGDPGSRPAQAYLALKRALAKAPNGESWGDPFTMDAELMQDVVDALLPVSGPALTLKESEQLWDIMTDWLTPYWTEAEIAGKFDVSAITSGWSRTSSSRGIIPRFGPLHYPLTYALKRWLNDPKNHALEILNAAARTLNVCQLKLTNLAPAASKGIVYQWQPFHEHEFEFHSPSHAVLPLNNRMGFRLK